MRRYRLPSFPLRALLRLAPGFALAALAGCAVTRVDLQPVAAEVRPSGLPAHWERGAFIEIFVRAYQDSDGDGTGDLRGLISRLDYLQELGVTGIWLMPVTRSADGDHGYATTDFRSVEPAYGTLADFDELLEQAHRRGIGVIMDYVVNHAAASHPMFELARRGPGAAFRDWFVWADERPEGWFIWDKHPWYHTASQPWQFQGPARDLPQPAADARGFYFGTFGPRMPDFDFRHPAVKAYHFDSLRFWLNRGLDGFRLDAVPHLIENGAQDWNDQPQSRALTREVVELVHGYPNRYVVCEATASPEAWGDPQVCGAAFAFGYVQHFVGAAQGKAASVHRLATYYRDHPWTMATFISNHDIFAGRRLWDQLGGDERAYRVAAAGYLLQPGTPFIYYGEEIGQGGVHSLDGDQPLRSPMSWNADPRTAGFTHGTPFRPVAPNAATHNVAAQQADPQSLLNFYKAMLRLRNTRPSLARGGFDHAFADDLVLGFQRRLDNERTLVLLNYGRTQASSRVDGLPPRARLVPLYPVAGTATVADERGTAVLPLSPQSVMVFDVAAAKEPGRPPG
jgi:glycosidase